MKLIRIISIVCFFVLVSVGSLLAQQLVQGAFVRADTTQKKLAIIFSADEFGDGADIITNALKKENVPASFFFTGRFYRNRAFTNVIRKLQADGHYLGAHSDQHPLYADWTKRDSTLITRQAFRKDLRHNYAAMKKFGITTANAHFFLPPYEWYNKEIVRWTKDEGLQLINFTPGTLSNADYTTPEMKNYRSSDAILQSVWDYERLRPAGLNGFMLLLHFGTDPKRTDKLYRRLPELIRFLKANGYELVRVDQLHFPDPRP